MRLIQIITNQQHHISSNDKIACAHLECLTQIPEYITPKLKEIEEYLAMLLNVVDKAEKIMKKQITFVARNLLETIFSNNQRLASELVAIKQKMSECLG